MRLDLAPPHLERAPKNHQEPFRTIPASPACTDYHRMLESRRWLTPRCTFEEKNGFTPMRPENRLHVPLTS